MSTKAERNEWAWRLAASIRESLDEGISEYADDDALIIEAKKLAETLDAESETMSEARCGELEAQWRSLQRRFEADAREYHREMGR